MVSQVMKLAVNHSTHQCHKHAALVLRGGSIVAVGVNHGNVHAEVAALKRLPAEERRGTRIISIRVRRSGTLGLAKPCEDCIAYLRANHVKHVVFSTNDGQMERMKL